MDDLEIGGATAPVKPLARKGKPAAGPMTDGTSALALEVPIEGTIEPEVLATVEKDRRLAVFSAAGALDPIITAIEVLARKHVPDLTTDKGRKAIASVASQVARCKVRLDDAGKELVAELKALPTAIDANRRAMRDRLDALRDETRAPLTQWEADQQRQVEFVDAIKAMPIQAQGATADRLRELINGLKARDLLQAPDFAEEALKAQQMVLRELERMLEERRQDDADAAELARLRKEAAEHQAQEAEAQQIRDANARALQEAEQARARAEQEKIAAEQRAQDAEATAARAKADSAAAAEKAAQDVRDRQAEDDRQAKVAEQRRAADKEHRRAINVEAMKDLMTNAGLTPEQAQAVIIAIYNQTISHVAITY